MSFNKVECIDTFKDEGYTARNFDRPDIKQLFNFIRKNYKGIDFLVVSELTRFSREAGDAINMVKRIQTDYDIRIVSAGRGTIYDCMDHNSFFMMGLEFLLGNSENIKRQNDINAGIYTAKAIKGLWIKGGRSPYGYKKVGVGEKRRLVVNEVEGPIVQFIFSAFLNNTPIREIQLTAAKLGFDRTGNSAIQDILSNPLYYGYQYVKPWKEEPGGLFPLIDHMAIVDVVTWHRVQEKLKGEPKVKISLDTDFPLRGVLKCHCGLHLTGAPSKGRNGTYYGYYKCKVSGHGNINAKKAHEQLHEVLKWMSLPERLLKKIKEESTVVLDRRLSDNKSLLRQKEYDLRQLESDLNSDQVEKLGDLQKSG